MQMRMIPPEVFTDPDLGGLEKRCVLVGLMQLAEDSGCVKWDARLVKHHVFGWIDDITPEHVRVIMEELEQDGRAKVYAVKGRPYALLPDFRVWQTRLGRHSAPLHVPLPVWVTYEPYTAKERLGSGTYSVNPDAEEHNPAETHDGHNPESSRVIRELIRADLKVMK